MELEADRRGNLSELSRVHRKAHDKSLESVRGHVLNVTVALVHLGAFNDVQCFGGRAMLENCAGDLDDLHMIIGLPESM